MQPEARRFPHRVFLETLDQLPNRARFVQMLEFDEDRRVIR